MKRNGVNMAELFYFKEGEIDPCFLIIYRFKGAKVDPDREKLKWKPYGGIVPMENDFILEGLTRGFFIHNYYNQ